MPAVTAAAVAEAVTQVGEALDEKVSAAEQAHEGAVTAAGTAAAEATAEVGALLDGKVTAAEEARSGAAEKAGAATTQAGLASTDRTATEAARDAAIAAGVVVGTYASTAAGLAAVAEGATFWAPSGADTLQQYTKTGGAAVPVAGNAMPTAAAISGINSALGMPQGFGNRSPQSGNTTVGSTNYFLCSNAILSDGLITKLHVYAQTAGSVFLAVYRPPAGVAAATGVTLTRLVNQAIDVSSGLNVLDVSVEVQAGDLLGISGSGILRFDNTLSGDGPRFYSVTDANTPTLSALISDYKWDFGFTVTPKNTAETGVAIAISGVKSDVDFLLTHIAAPQSLGIATPSSGTNTSTSGNVILGATPVAQDNTLTQIRLFAQVDGEITTLVYRPPSGVDPEAGVVVSNAYSQTLSVVSGINEIAVSIPVKQRDLIGIVGSGILRWDAAQTGGGFRYRSVSATGAITLGSLSSDVAWQFGFTLSGGIIGAAAAALKPTIGYILAWGVGQSNLAGRGTSPSSFVIEAGRSFKFDPVTSALAHLADPTGTDATAQTGRSSVGPALAQAVLEATGGRIGVIFVNTAIGGTSISTWQTGGSSWTAAVEKWEDAIASAVALGLNVVGCCGVMIHGETDAAAALSPATYKSGVLSLLSQMRAETGCDDLPLIITQIGIDTDVPESAGYAAIRAAQAELARAGNGIFMAHAGAKNFGTRGLMVDDLHYNAQGLDEVGGALGIVVASRGVGLRPSGMD